MNATTVAVDLAKSVFEIAVADQNWKVVERARLGRRQFERWFLNRSVGLVVIEACGSAHFWGRRNGLRGVYREFGICIVVGSRLGMEQISRVVVDQTSTSAPVCAYYAALMPVMAD